MFESFNRMLAVSRIAALGAATLVLAQHGASASEVGKIQIGLITPFSGPAASFGPPQRASLQYAIERVNAAGGVQIGGKTYHFELKTYDSAYDPTKAVTVTRQALTQDGLKYLEVLGGGVAGAVQPLAEGAGALMFVMGAGKHFIGPSHPTTFQPYYNIPRAMEASLKALLKTNPNQGRRIVHLYTDDDLGADLAPDSSALAGALGFQSRTILVARDVTDFASILTGIVADTDLIDFGSMPPSQYAVVARQARQLGYKGDFIFPSTLNLAVVLKTAGAKAVAGSVTAPFWNTATSEAGKAWTARMQADVGTVQPWTAQNYDNLFLLRAAMNKAGSLEPDAVAKALQVVSYNEGVLGEVSYSAERVFTLNYPVGRVTEEGTLELLD